MVENNMYEEIDRKSIIGCGKGLFVVPEDFDDIDLSDEFDEDLFV